MEEKPYLHKVFLFVLYGLLIVFVYFNLNKNSCDYTTTYSVGRLDKEFGISRDDVESYAQEASNLWNEALPNKKLLKEETKSEVTINFVFDERQRATIQSQKLKAKIQEQKQNLTEVRNLIDGLKSEYNKKLNAYNIQKDTYEAKQNKYNEDVSYWNDRGGAPEKEYNDLANQKVNLDNEFNSLTVSLNELKALSTKINTYRDSHNATVKEVNAVVDAVNAHNGTEFEEGVFDPKDNSITIYEYENALGLKRVLAHELGHALGIDHVLNKNSIMYYLNDSKDFKLSNEDIQALKKVCKIK